MIQRPSFAEIYMCLAEKMAERATCNRTDSAGRPMQVGCIITDPKGRNVIGVGYNGNAAGLVNGCDSTTPGACGCIHAEANAAVKSVPDIPKIVYCTHLPCVNCAKLLINLGGVQKVFYRKDYRLKDSLELFRRVGIGVGHLYDDGVTEEEAIQTAVKALDAWNTGDRS